MGRPDQMHARWAPAAMRGSGVKVAAALELLGMSRPYTADDVRIAYRSRVKASHPDAGGSAAVDQHALRQAKDCLLSALKTGHDSEAQTCQVCKGRGNVPVGFGTQTCVMCKGTGEYHASYGN